MGWGAVYAQYLESMDQISGRETDCLSAVNYIKGMRL